LKAGRVTSVRVPPADGAADYSDGVGPAIAAPADCHPELAHEAFGSGPVV